MKRISWLFLLVAVMSMLGAGCAPKIVGLDSSRWILTELDGAQVTGSPEITLIFDGNRISGKDGCNQYGGEFELSGAIFSIKDGLASTMMACEEAIMTRASAYTQLLTHAESVSLSGDTLTLTTPDNKKLVFARQNTNLDGTSWNVTAYNDGNEAVVSLLADTQITVEFSADGKVAGSAGCNRFKGSYETQDLSIKVSVLSTSKSMCMEPDGVMTQEAQFLQAMQQAATYEISGSTLNLRDTNGQSLVNLTKQ